MEMLTSYYAEKLKEELTLRQRKNEGYSLRAFSRDLGMHSSTLSLVIKGKRPIPIKNLEKVISCLRLKPMEETLFRESIFKNKTKLDEVKISDEYQQRFMIDESYYKVIAEWEHYAVLSLIELKGFKSCYEYVAKKLKISIARAEVVISNLKNLGLIGVNDRGEFYLSQGPLRTTEDVKSKAIRESHIETLELGKRKLDEVDVNFRDFSSMTIAVNPEKIQEAKTIIREFRQKLATLLRDGEKSEVFQVGIQLYPLTEMNGKNIEEQI